MTIELTDSVKAYLTDKSIRAAVDDLLDHDEDKAELYLPWDEARDFAKARMMAEVTKHEVIEFLFSLWDEVWGRHDGQLGTELPEDHEIQDSFMPEYTWSEKGLKKAFSRNHALSINPYRFVYFSIYIWEKKGLIFSVRSVFFG